MNRKAVVFMICLALAMVFWIINALTGTYETTHEVRLSYTNQPYNTRITGSLPPIATLHYRGSGWELIGLNLSHIPDSILVDLKSAADENGKIQIPSARLRSQLTGKLLPYKIDPDLIAPVVVSQASIRVPVVFKNEMRFRMGFGLPSQPILTPDSVDISGPKAVLQKINSVETENINLKDLHKPESLKVKISKNLPKEVTLSEAYIQVEIPVAEFTEGQLKIPVEVRGNFRKKITLIPASVTISFHVGLRDYNSVRPEDFRAFVSPSPEGLNLKELEVQLEKKPDYARNIRLEPAFVEYLYEP